MAVADALRVGEVSHLEEVDQTAWDRLINADGFYLSYQWLLGQQDPNIRATYLLVYDGEMLVGALPLYRFRRSRAAEYEQLFLRSGELLFAGARTGWRSQFAVAADLTAARQGEVVRLLVDRAVEIALDEGYAGVVFDYLTPAGLRQLTSVAAPLASFRTVEAEIDLAGRTFEEYVSDLPIRMRSKVRHEMRVFAAAGWRIDHQRLSECLDEVSHLLANLEQRYGSNLDSATIREFLARQAKYADDHSLVFSCRDDAGRMIGYAMMFAWRDTLYARVAGFDYGRLRRSYEYFNLAYYLPLRYMERHGMRRLHLGVKSMDAKARRGALVHPLYAAAMYGPSRDGGTGPRWVGLESLHAARRELAGIAAVVLPADEWDLAGTTGEPNGGRPQAPGEQST